MQEKTSLPLSSINPHTKLRYIHDQIISYDIDDGNLADDELDIETLMQEQEIEHHNINSIEPLIQTIYDYEFEEGDILIKFTESLDSGIFAMELVQGTANCFTMKKNVDRKVKPVPGVFPEEARVIRRFPHDPLADLPTLDKRPPEFKPTERITAERIAEYGLEDGFLWPEEIKLFQQVILNNEETLPYKETDRGVLSPEYFSDYIMPTIDHVPWVFKNIPIPPGILDKVIELLQGKIDAGVYEPSQSSYRCRWFCVQKKNGTLRVIHDLQPLNQVSIRDAGLLPVLDEFVEPYAGSQCCTVFDLYWGFDARRVHPQSRDLTAFYSPLGLLRITSLPMGYTNSPAEFQRCMSFILQHEIPTYANIFIDDLPIRGPQIQYLDKDMKPEVLSENPGIRRFIWEHAVDVNRVMHRIKKAGATFSPKKCQICKPSVVILGQTCSAEGRTMDVTRVEKILKWPIPKSVKEVRGFLGICGTVRIWIKDYSLICRPLTKLTRKDQPFDWGPDQQKAFDHLKKLITTAPALRSIDYRSDHPIILSVDTSRFAVGMILSQEDETGKRRPARFGSIMLTPTESRYSQAKLELYGLFRALTAWRQYIIGTPPLVVEVDAQYIKGMINSPDILPQATLNRWIQGILLYDFKLVHVPAQNFKGPDALSRRPPASDEEPVEYDDSWLDDIALLQVFNLETVPGDTSEDTTINQEDRESDYVPDDVGTLKTADQTLIDVQHLLEHTSLPPNKTFSSLQARKRFVKYASQFFIRDNKLYKRNGQQIPLRVILNPMTRTQILKKSHDDLGHKGENAVHDLLRLRFFWPHMRRDVHQYIQSCHTCQVRSLKRLHEPLRVYVPVTIFQTIFLDVMYMIPFAGFHGIVAAKDDLTGVSEARPIKQSNSETMARFLLENIYCRYGMVGRIITDNGPEVAKAFDILVKRLNIPRARIAPYNKRANGAVERGHFILREALVRSCKKNARGIPINWPQKLPMAVFADKVTVSSVTGYSPYFLLHGVDPVLSFDLSEATFLYEGYRSGMTTAELLALRIKHLSRHEADLAQAAANLRKARFRSKEQFNRRFKKRFHQRIFQPGELVIKHNTRHEMEVNRFKYEDRYLGPYEVVDQLPQGYRLREMDGAILKEIVAGSRLLPYITRNDPVLSELVEDVPEEESEQSEQSENQSNEESVLEEQSSN